MMPRGNGVDRQLMSPRLDNSMLSDCLENLMSDFDDVLAPHKEIEKVGKKKNFPKFFFQTQKTVSYIRNRSHGGYNSDYTTYRRGGHAPHGPPPNHYPPELPRRAAPHFEPGRSTIYSFFEIKIID